MADFILRNVDDTLWEQFKARAASEGRTLRWIVMKMISEYVRYGVRPE